MGMSTLNDSQDVPFSAQFWRAVPGPGRRSEPMTKQPHTDLSRRERQIVDILYANGRATAAEVQAALPEPPSYSAVRAMLRILEEKGHVRHEQDGPRYVYVPTVARDNAKRSALRHVLQTFFDGSAEQAISALLDDRSAKLSDGELDRLAQLIKQARQTGA
jgi:predicted transcriptional regulator